MLKKIAYALECENSKNKKAKKIGNFKSLLDCSAILLVMQTQEEIKS